MSFPDGFGLYFRRCQEPCDLLARNHWGSFFHGALSDRCQRS
nr:MAG TPA: hypothetical protein [Caudoviricetes sp.]